jgi:hypothetical protein
MKRLVLIGGLLVVPLLVFVGSSALAGHKANGNNVSTTLAGFAEVPAVSSTGHGTFSAEISSNKITYTLTYSGLRPRRLWPMFTSANRRLLAASSPSSAAVAGRRSAPHPEP